MIRELPKPDDEEAVFEAAIERRLERMATDVAALDHRLAALREEQDGVQRDRDELAERLGHLRAAIGDEAALATDAVTPAEPADMNQSIADMVVALVSELGPLHYRRIEEELRRRYNIRVGGKDPANTLLARYYQDERLVRPARGTYALRDGKRARSVGARRKRQQRSRSRAGSGERRVDRSDR